MKVTLTGTILSFFILIGSCSKIIVLKDFFSKSYLFQYDYTAKSTDVGESQSVHQHIIDKIIRDAYETVPYGYKSHGNGNYVPFTNYYIDYHKPIRASEEISVVAAVTKRDATAETITVYGIRKGNTKLQPHVNFFETKKKDETEYLVASLKYCPDTSAVIENCNVKFIANIVIKGGRTLFESYNVPEGQNVTSVKYLEKYVLSIC